MKEIVMDLTFTVKTNKNFENLTKEEILIALAQRVLSLANDWDLDAFGFVDESETEDEEILCSLCSEYCSLLTAHIHQGKYIGDECCWDERLRITE